jgi:hypothetical protein
MKKLNEMLDHIEQGHDLAHYAAHAAKWGRG